MDDALLNDIRSRINPQYQDIKGTESYERKQMADEIDRLKAELVEANYIIKSDITRLQSLLVGKEISTLKTQLIEARAELKHVVTCAECKSKYIAGQSGACPYCAAESLTQQLQQAHREGWEQCKRESVETYCNVCGQGCPRDALCDNSKAHRNPI